jgi:hypothetical protein
MSGNLVQFDMQNDRAILVAGAAWAALALAKPRPSIMQMRIRPKGPLLPASGHVLEKVFSAANQAPTHKDAMSIVAHERSDP